MARIRAQEAEELYQMAGWGDRYFRVGGRGHLQVQPLGPDGPAVDLFDVVSHLIKEGMPPPLVLRFPQILHDRVRRLNDAFLLALKENDCSVRYRGVFPVKVNQRREVVQELAKAGRRYAHGLEVGSKAELIAALAMDPNRRSLLIVNGFKDRPFLEAACDATAFKDEVIIVMDEVGELPFILPELEKTERPPIVGLRLKLRAKAPGKWALSGGERAKFGLTIPEVLHAVEELRTAGHLDRLQMLHFHIGSQLTHIRRVANGVREAARVYAELHRMGAPVRLLDVGGGLGVDYDGSGSSGPNSCNYTPEEYANTVVATIKDVCEDAGVPMPDIISESGRAAVAHHAVFVTDVMRRVPHMVLPPDRAGPHEDDPTPLWNLYEIRDELSAKTAFESFHDVLQHRDDVFTLFDLGHLSLEALGRAERLVRHLMDRIRTLLMDEDETDSEEYRQVCSLLGQKLVANFSIFQSLPDVWGVKQQFPVVPLHRLLERPGELATIADITCDSDGEIRQFIDAYGTRPDLPVHALRAGEPYYLAMCLVGAYQDSLGDYHNLFGETNEAFIEVDENGEWTVGRPTHGSRVQEMLAWVRYDPADLRRRLRRRIERLRENGRIDEAEAQRLRTRIFELMDSSTYLEAR